MYFKILILIAFTGNSLQSALPSRGRDTILDRIITLGDDQPVSSSADWRPNTRGQFMRDILFGIHPDSPRNREFWAKSGYTWGPQRPQPPVLRKVLVPIVQPRPPLELESNAKPPLKQKLIPTPAQSLKRLPKLIDATEKTVAVNVTPPKAVNKSVVPKLPFSSPINPAQLNPPKLNLPIGRTGAQNIPTCFMQTTVPVIYYYLLPATPYFIPQGINQGVQQQQPQQSLFNTASYAPIQNRLPFPPQHQTLYFQPVPLDLLAMEDIKVEKEAKQDLETEKIKSVPKSDKSEPKLPTNTPSKGTESKPKEQKNKKAQPEIHEFRQEILPSAVEPPKIIEKTPVPETKITKASTPIEVKIDAVSKKDNVTTTISKIEVLLEKEILAEEKTKLKGESVLPNNNLTTTEHPTTTKTEVVISD